MGIGSRGTMVTAGRLGWRLLFALLATALLVFSQASMADAAGELSWARGPAACISTTGSAGACEDGGIIGGGRGTISPDGKHLYLTSYTSGTVVVLDRNPRTGQLRQKRGKAACTADDPGEIRATASCARGRAFEEPEALAISPDGRTVYVASEHFDAVAIFDRDRATGALTQRPGKAGCISAGGAKDGCEQARAIKSPTDLTISPDGRNLYVSSLGTPAVAVFDVDPATGGLTQEPGAAGCVSGDGAGVGCGEARSLAGGFHLTLSPDGKSLYVSSYEQPPLDSVQIGPSSLVIFDRDLATGSLVQKAGPDGCIAGRETGDGCRVDPLVQGVGSVAVSPDGRSAYVASSEPGGVLSIFDRDPVTGSLKRKEGAAGCISRDGSSGACGKSSTFSGLSAVAVSPDGSSVYVASRGSIVIGNKQAPRNTASLIVFDRDPTTGALRQKPGARGCIAASPAKTCGTSKGLGIPGDLVATSDGKNLYVVGHHPGTVSTFDRARR
jgi:DNA-binding beta-propeller fold protein YncE